MNRKIMDSYDERTGMFDFQTYQTWYAKQSFLWRVKNQLHWTLRTIWCALCNKPGPGERFLLSFIARGANATQVHKQTVLPTDTLH